MGKHVMQNSYYADVPHLLPTNISAFISLVKTKYPDLYKAARGKKFPAITMMDPGYTTWTKSKGKGKRRSSRKRYISMASNPHLKEIQARIYNLFSLPSHGCVYSYKTGLSTPKCAINHIGKFALYKLDITDYFPSITREMIYSLYSNNFADLLKLMGTKQRRSKTLKESIELVSRIIAIATTKSDDRGVNNLDAVLPIGIEPASTISNNVLIGIDRDLFDLSEKRGIIYSRYSDNMFFSSTTGTHIKRETQDEIKKIVEGFEFQGTYPFKINPSKTRYSPRWRQQRVLGIVVNEKLNIPKGREKWLRSALNHLFYDVRDIYAQIIPGLNDYSNINDRLNHLHRKAQKVFGQLSYVRTIAPAKRFKYSTHHHAVKLLLEESKLQLQACIEEQAEALALQAGGS